MVLNTLFHSKSEKCWSTQLNWGQYAIINNRSSPQHSPLIKEHRRRRSTLPCCWVLLADLGNGKDSWKMKQHKLGYSLDTDPRRKHHRPPARKQSCSLNSLPFWLKFHCMGTLSFQKALVMTTSLNKEVSVRRPIFKCKADTCKAWFQASEEDLEVTSNNIAPTIDLETADSSSIKNLEWDF